MSDGTETEYPVSTETEQAAEAVEQQQEQKPAEQMVPQADVDRIVRERVARERAKFADYDDLKSKAGEAKSLEERLGELEQRAKDAEASALRSNIAAQHGISAEDRDLFLTGTDEATLTAQAKRLGERVADQKKQGGVAPNEGKTTTNPGADGGLREFASNLFGSQS